MPHEILQIGNKITVLPIIHGSGDFALEVRRTMLEHDFDCVAVPLPPSFQVDVEQSIDRLPIPTMVTQVEHKFLPVEWTPERESAYDSLDEADQNTLSYVPIDPCQGVIAALRIAIGEHIPRAFVDLETSHFEAVGDVLPDPYALKTVPLHRFAAAVLPTIDRLPAGQPQARAVHMANRLRQLEADYEAIVFVCSILEWPWIRSAYLDRVASVTEDDLVEDTVVYQPNFDQLLFMFGELPFITGLYERARSELEDDTNLSIDGVKELFLAARDTYRAELKHRARKITPHMLSRCLQYVRNLSLIERRMTPDLYSLVMAAKQMVGDQYALQVAETAGTFPYTELSGLETLNLGIDRAELSDGNIVDVVSRLPGPPVSWRSCNLQRRPERIESDQWKMRWNPLAQCSWPPEDNSIENFRAHVVDRAKAIVGADLAQSEKFTTSIKDGIDIRETIRHWHDGDIYIKVLPANRGKLDCVVMLFDSPADPRQYPWRTTWFAEHAEESTLGFFATNFQDELVGPGIGLATYGGALFLFPPLAIPDIWTDPRLDFTETMEERLLAAACLHSLAPRIVLLSSDPPGAGWRRLAKRFKKQWIHVPLGQFSDSTIQQLRMVHVLNGKEIRSFASHFIRKV